MTNLKKIDLKTNKNYANKCKKKQFINDYKLRLQKYFSGI